MPEFTAASQARHIEINAGNVLTIGVLSLLWFGAACWGSNLIARTNIPVISQAAIGAQNFLHAA
jgi:hypothetical protein